MTVCPTCGPLPPPQVHDRCHKIPGLQPHGCGHALRDHSEGMRCRVCDVDCAGGPRTWQTNVREVNSRETNRTQPGGDRAALRLFD